MEKLVKRKIKEYRIWKNMKARCYSPCNIKHGKYQENNIQVCDRWRSSFDNFMLDMGKCPENYSLDRINNNGNYEPGNCRWSSCKTQSQNRGEFNLSYTYNNETKTLSEWAETLNIKYNTLHKRIYRSKFSFEKAITYKK